MYSILNLCYYVRLLDDAMDGHQPAGPLLAALSFFHSRYQDAYRDMFGPSDAFWGRFFELNDLACDLTARDLVLKDVTREDFETIAARKSCAALIAMAAIAMHHGRMDAYPAWEDFWYAFGRWNQMRDDLADWHRDLKNGMDTYLLSEARRRKHPEEDVVHWLLREGFDWAGDTLAGFGLRALECARCLGSVDVETYTARRVDEVSAQIAALKNAMAALDAAAGAR